MTLVLCETVSWEFDFIFNSESFKAFVKYLLHLGVNIQKLGENNLRNHTPYALECRYQEPSS